MKLRSTTLQLLAGVAAFTTAATADREPNAPQPAPAPKPEQAPAVKPMTAKQMMERMKKTWEKQIIEHRNLKTVFAVADLNKDGKITKDELQKAYLALEKAMEKAKQEREAEIEFLAICPYCGQG